MQTRSRTELFFSAPAFAAARESARLNSLSSLGVVVIIHNEVRAL